MNKRKFAECYDLDDMKESLESILESEHYREKIDRMSEKIEENNRIIKELIGEIKKMSDFMAYYFENKNISYIS